MYQLSLRNHDILTTFSRTITDSQWYVTDPEVEHIPVKELLSKVCGVYCRLVGIENN